MMPANLSASVIEISGDGTAHVVGPGGAVQDPAAAPASALMAEGEGGTSPVPDAAVTYMEPPPVPGALREPLMAAAARANVSPHLLAALVHQESGWRGQVVSAKGAMGFTQLMPATARQLGVDPHDPAANLAGGARYLRQMLDRFDGNVELALAAYNAGPARVQRTHAVPAIPETRAYVTNVLDRLTTIRPAPTQGLVP